MLKKFAIDKSTFDRFTTDPERRADLLRSVRRVALIALPAIGLSIFAGLLAWSIRRQLDALVEGLVVEPATEPTYEVGAEIQG